MKRKHLTLVILILTAVCLLVPALVQADAETEIKRITIRHERNLAAYERPTGHSRFVGWAKMSHQYDVLERVRGHKMLPWWYLIELEDGQKAYIPEMFTSPVIENAEDLAVGHVWINPQQNLHIHRKPDSTSAQMGWARKQQLYPLLSSFKEDGYWKIAMPDGTLGYVSSVDAFLYDPVEDAKPRWVYLPGRCVIREFPGGEKNPIMTGIGPGEVLRCVYVYSDEWYEVETKHGGYGFIHSSVCQLIEGEKPEVTESGKLVTAPQEAEEATPAEASR